MKRDDTSIYNLLQSALLDNSVLIKINVGEKLYYRIERIIDLSETSVTFYDKRGIKIYVPLNEITLAQEVLR